MDLHLGGRCSCSTNLPWVDVAASTDQRGQPCGAGEVTEPSAL